MSDHARVVIIGGGAVGCSALYHLALLGWTDCLLLERDELTSGSTWHAAGNCPTFSTSYNVIKLQRYSNRLYAELAAAGEAPITHHVTGSIRLAHSRDRMDEFRHVRAMARAQGLELELLTPGQANELYPFMETAELEGVLFDPYDGDVDPSQLTQAFAREARARGCRIRRFTRVIGLERRAEGWRVITDQGEIACEVVVNAAGYRAGEIMAMVGHYLPIVSMSHQYLMTEAIPELAGRRDKLPLLRDPDVSYYLRQERDGLLLGPYEWDARAHWLDGIPGDFANQLYDDDLDRLEPYIEAAIGRVPILGSVGVQRVINGPIPYSPDGNPYIGPAHGLTNFYQCCCFSFGIAQAGGAGKTLAEWVAHGEPEWDMWAFDSRRYTSYATRSYVLAKAVELYQREYAIALPYEERPAGRPARTSPLYDRLREKGARFGARGGWERAVWFAPEGDPVPDRPSFRRDERIWHQAVAEECRAVREQVGVADLCGFTKFMIEGPGAEAWLDRLSCSRLPKVGHIALAYMLNEKGGIVSEFTITRLGPERFYLISAAAAEWHDEDWLRAGLPDDGSVRIESVMSRLGTLVLTGPKAREVLSKVTEADLSNEAFPWLSAQETEIGMARVLALRLSYTGELGFELHMPPEHLVPVYEAICDAGEPHGLRDFGAYAMESLRLEKCYRAWKADLTHEYTPIAASLDRFVDFGKQDFIGKDALLFERQRGPRERLVPLVLDHVGAADAPPCAPVLLNDEIVGLVSSGAYGYTLQRSIALAYVRADLALPEVRVEVEILGERHPALIASEPLYDPGNERLRA
jgi:dimethylglycine dehydrogenase